MLDVRTSILATVPSTTLWGLRAQERRWAYLVEGFIE